MNKTVSKYLRIFGGVLVGLLLILADYVFWIFPIYPDFTRPLDSIAELREALREQEATNALYVVDLTEFGAAEQTIRVDLNGRTRRAEPVNYHIDSQNAGNHSVFTLGVSAGIKLWKDAEFDGEGYRNVEAKLFKLFASDTQSTRRSLELDLCCGSFEYAISGSFDATGLTEQELSEREADLQALVYSVADRIIDAAEAA